MITTETKPEIISSTEYNQNPQPPNPVKQLKKIIGSHVLETVSASVTVSLVLFGVSFVNTWGIYRGFRNTITEQFQLQYLSEQIIYLDEVLTMSARMGASTGDIFWEERYNQNVDPLDKTINELIELAPSYAEKTESTNEANQKLVAMEVRAFELVRSGKKDEALRLLLGTEYNKQKEIYATGVNTALQSIQTETDEHLENYSNRLLVSLFFSGISFLILAASGIGIIYLIRHYISDRTLAQESLEEAQNDLVKLNQELEESTKLLELQQQKTQAENESLQAEIGNLLEAVSSAEEGNLSVQAKVGEGVTGLVADTLNRLLEELAKVLFAVLDTVGQVSKTAAEVQELATNTVQQAKEQAESVIEVEGLMKNVTELSQENVAQALKANEAVQETQFAIIQGQQEMTQMTDSIITLEDGTGQITKRLDSLKDFVQLASQFSRDQKRVAALTRVLALNASMIANRASEQQDPEQFASIAQEFDTIANQVSHLATETNEGLLLLQQRTDQMQTVVSGLNEDVLEINQLVFSFSQGMTKSNQVFDNINALTQKLVMVEEQVTKSSEEIAISVNNSLTAINNIANIALTTEDQANISQQQTEKMEQLANKLLEMLTFFRL